MFEFVNDNNYDCGQAAACTFLAYHELIKADQAEMAEIEKNYPPDMFLGYFGTSPKQVKRIIESKMPVSAIHGPTELVDSVNKGIPVVIMLNYDSWSGHWCVATEIIGKFIHLTNYGDVELDKILVQWNGWIPRIMGFNQYGYVKETNAGH